MSNKVIIVGAGISGISAGCYARMNGYDTTILEMHNLPGGLCAAWTRKGYTFDISMHMLTGSVSGPFHQMWKELGIPQKFGFHFHDHISKVEGMGHSLLLPTDRQGFEERMLAISPEDGTRIRQLTKLLFGPDMMNAASLKPAGTRNMFDGLRSLMAVMPMFRVFGRYKGMTIQEFAAGFAHPFLREAVRFLIDAPGWPMHRFPMLALAGFIRTGVTESGVPLGGSYQVLRHMAGLFTGQGGEIRYKSKVTDLVIEDDRVKGVLLADGERLMADRVIWAGDGHSLIYGILDGKYMSPTIRGMYENWTPVRSMVHVMLGVDMDFSKESHRIIFEAETPIVIAGMEHRWLGFLHHCFDPSMAPEGKSAIEVWYDTEFDYWDELARDREAYLAEKRRIADYTIRQLDLRWPGLAEKVEYVDVPTPHTYARYTGNWKGSPDGWYITPDNMRVQEPLRELPGLQGLKMVGQWTAPFTGTVIAALSGRQAIHLMCREDGKQFRARMG